MKSKLRVMVVEPDKEPYEKFLKDSLEAMYEIVGKPIEVTRDILLPGMLLVVNEEGKLRGLPINRCTGDDIICGTFFVCRNGKDDFKNLTDADVEEIKTVYGLPKGTCDKEDKEVNSSGTDSSM